MPVIADAWLKLVMNLPETLLLGLLSASSASALVSGVDACMKSNSVSATWVKAGIYASKQPGNGMSCRQQHSSRGSGLQRGVSQCDCLLRIEVSLWHLVQVTDETINAAHGQKVEHKRGGKRVERNGDARWPRQVDLPAHFCLGRPIWRQQEIILTRH